MPKVLKINKGAEEGVRELLKFLLESGRVKGVLTLCRISEDGAVSYLLITDAAEIEDALPLFPLMPTNAATALSRLTLNGPATELIAAVVRPCELRAFVELVKRSQGSMENLLLISSTCGGVYPFEMATNGKIAENLPQYWEAIGNGDIAAEPEIYDRGSLKDWGKSLEVRDKCSKQSPVLAEYPIRPILGQTANPDLHRVVLLQQHRRRTA